MKRRRKEYEHRPRLVFEHPVTSTRLTRSLPAHRVCADCGEPVVEKEPE